jgi:hypothetical protein
LVILLVVGLYCLVELLHLGLQHPLYMLGYCCLGLRGCIRLDS